MTNALRFLIGITFCLVHVHAGPGGARNIYSLSDQADAIVVGRLDTVAVAAVETELSISVSRVLKGSIPSATSIRAMVPVASSGVPDIPGEQRIGLWFLKSESPNVWTVLPVAVGDVPLSMTYIVLGQMTIEEDSDDIEQEQGGNGWFEAVLQEVERSVSGGVSSQISLFLSLGAFDTERSTASLAMYSRLSQSPNDDVKILGLQSLVRNGETTALVRLIDNGEKWDNTRKSQLVNFAICDFRSSSPSAIEALLRIIRSNFPESTKVCSAYSLRAVHSTGMLPIFVELLKADMPRLRYEGVAGLASYANGLERNDAHVPPAGGPMLAVLPAEQAPFRTQETRDHFPDISSFYADESRYIGFWENWWNRYSGILTQ